MFLGSSKYSRGLMLSTCLLPSSLVQLHSIGLPSFLATKANLIYLMKKWAKLRILRNTIPPKCVLQCLQPCLQCALAWQTPVSACTINIHTYENPAATISYFSNFRPACARYATGRSSGGAGPFDRNMCTRPALRCRPIRANSPG